MIAHRNGPNSQPGTGARPVAGRDVQRGRGVLHRDALPEPRADPHRIRPDPLWELVLAVHMLEDSRETLLFSHWRREAVGAIRGSRRPHLNQFLALTPNVGYFPDFLNPIAASRGIHHGLEAIRRKTPLRPSPRRRPARAVSPAVSPHQSCRPRRSVNPGRTDRQHMPSTKPWSPLPAQHRVGGRPRPNVEDRGDGRSRRERAARPAPPSCALVRRRASCPVASRPGDPAERPRIATGPGLLLRQRAHDVVRRRAAARARLFDSNVGPTTSLSADSRIGRPS